MTPEQAISAFARGLMEAALQHKAEEPLTPPVPRKRRPGNPSPSEPPPQESLFEPGVPIPPTVTEITEGMKAQMEAVLRGDVAPEHYRPEPGNSPWMGS